MPRPRLGWGWARGCGGRRGGTEVERRKEGMVMEKKVTPRSACLFLSLSLSLTVTLSSSPSASHVGGVASSAAAATTLASSSTAAAAAAAPRGRVVTNDGGSASPRRPHGGGGTPGKRASGGGSSDGGRMRASVRMRTTLARARRMRPWQRVEEWSVSCACRANKRAGDRRGGRRHRKLQAFLVSGWRFDRGPAHLISHQLCPPLAPPHHPPLPRGPCACRRAA